MKNRIAKVTVGLALSGVAGVGVTTGLSPSAGAAVPSVSTSTTAPARHPLRVWVRAHRRELARHVVGISAGAIGITPGALVSGLRSGQSIAEVAQTHQVAPQTVVTALVQAGDTLIDRAVDNHTLTPTQGAKIEAALPGVMHKVVDHVHDRRGG
jgi:hypothetical protein